MYFNKCHQPENFIFNKDTKASDSLTIDGKTFRSGWKHLGEDVHRLEVRDRRWAGQHSQAELTTSFDLSSDSHADFTPRSGVTLTDPKGKALLASEPGRVFGVSGQAWMMQFQYAPDMRFYGMGEKNMPLERSERHTKFWNTDVWADFNMMQVIHASPDPAYLSIPYLIIKRGNNYAGILINNPYAVFMSTNPHVRIAEQKEAEEQDTRFFIGAPDGRPELYFIVGPSLDELTRKLQRLVGTTPRPPLWSLGHQQCRWGYASYKDLDQLDQAYTRYKIPNDGLWLDIDYMRGYRVFTWDDKHWSNVEKQIEKIQKRGQRVVPILDPGVKLDQQFDVYKSGKRAEVYCKNPAGTDFVGFVWPGTTVFPDFSLEQTRDWWSNWTSKAVAGIGIEGVWIDMNDPSTGLSENSEMLFDNGKLPHEAYHNQYAFGMAKATHQGLLKNRPNQRPFILTRSGFTSINRYAAAWTGDNFSNDHHMRSSIATTLNLALSGLPFNGPDVPGFGGDATGDLATAWYKLGFLFPVLRNHSGSEARFQEPWTFSPKVTRIIRHYIRLRYKLLPYLYNLFIRQELTGEAILRPLLYDFTDRKRLPLDKIDDQFMVGPAIMQAPHTESEPETREVILPDANWFDATTGRWIRGGQSVKAKPDDQTTPLYIRDGAIIPMRPGTPTDNHTDLTDIELHIFLSKDFKGKATCTYTADDGLSFDYQKDQISTITFEVSRTRNGLKITAGRSSNDFGDFKVRFVIYEAAESLDLHTGEARKSISLRDHKWIFTGTPLACRKSTSVKL